jgi:3-oxoacyl-[acyl-carrier protein] reductase
MRGPERFFLTGCASGIGRHLADRLIAQGLQVMATDINTEALQAAAENGGWPAARVRLRRLDVRDPKDWEEAIAEGAAAFGELDVVLNIAGYMQSEWVHQSTVQTIDRHVDINLKGVIHGTVTASRQMLKQGHGHIINIASLAGLAPIPGLAVYSATKYACRAYSLAAALELRERNIFVTTISPDAVDTPLLDPQEGVEAAALLFSSRHLLTVEEIARLVIDHALRHRPMEATIPRWRGWVARLTNIFPWLGFGLAPIFRWMGAKRQEHYFKG